MKRQVQIKKNTVLYFTALATPVLENVENNVAEPEDRYMSIQEMQDFSKRINSIPNMFVNVIEKNHTYRIAESNKKAVGYIFASEYSDEYKGLIVHGAVIRSNPKSAKLISKIKSGSYDKVSLMTLTYVGGYRFVDHLVISDIALFGAHKKSPTRILEFQDDALTEKTKNLIGSHPIINLKIDAITSIFNSGILDIRSKSVKEYLDQRMADAQKPAANISDLVAKIEEIKQMQANIDTTAIKSETMKNMVDSFFQSIDPLVEKAKNLADISTTTTTTTTPTTPTSSDSASDASSATTEPVGASNKFIEKSVEETNIELEEMIKAYTDAIVPLLVEQGFDQGKISGTIHAVFDSEEPQTELAAVAQAATLFGGIMTRKMNTLKSEFENIRKQNEDYAAQLEALKKQQQQDVKAPKADDVPPVQEEKSKKRKSPSDIAYKMFQSFNSTLNESISNKKQKTEETSDKQSPATNAPPATTSTPETKTEQQQQAPKQSNGSSFYSPKINAEFYKKMFETFSE